MIPLVVACQVFDFLSTRRLFDFALTLITSWTEERRKVTERLQEVVFLS